MPKVSIIVPIYNVEKYLDRCMQTLINQTLKDIEIIMVDDGSLDNCPKLCDEYAKKDNRIKVIHKKNGGLGYARNSGLDVATGEYVAFVDSDDFVDVNMYENLYNEVLVGNYDAVFCSFYTEVSNGKWVISNEISENQVFSHLNIKKFMLGMIASPPYVHKDREYNMSVWHAIYNLSFIKKNNIKFYSERNVAAEDTPFQIDFLLKAKKVKYIKRPYYYYCFNNSSLTHSFNIKSFHRNKVLRRILFEKLDDKESHLRLDRYFIGTCRGYIYSLLESDRKDKIRILKIMVNDKIWTEISNNYLKSYLPLNSKIIYWLTLNKKIRILYIYVKLILYLKHIKKCCH